MKSGVDFIGRDAIAVQLANGVKKRLATFTAAPEVVLLARETIYRNGERVGWLSSGGFGHTVGKSIGMGYVRHPEGVTEDFILSGTYELDVASERVPAKVALTPLYDPQNLRVKA
jgi:4-methylaminobutanoate oxidase (formaldehyde-forming)